MGRPVLKPLEEILMVLGMNERYSAIVTQDKRNGVYTLNLYDSELQQSEYENFRDEYMQGHEYALMIRRLAKKIENKWKI